MAHSGRGSSTDGKTIINKVILERYKVCSMTMAFLCMTSLRLFRFLERAKGKGMRLCYWGGGRENGRGLKMPPA